MCGVQVVRAAYRQKMALATVGIAERARGPSEAGGLADPQGRCFVFLKGSQSPL